jgi:HlyD family type I secretion membrane fusion protein
MSRPSAQLGSSQALDDERLQRDAHWRDSFALPARPRTTWPIAVGVLVIVGFLGGLGAWAALAPISAAAVAQGQLRVEGNRRTVQHLEGGIIREFLVRDGAAVRQGEVLLRLDDAQSGATADNFRAQLDAAHALNARLVAERDHRDSIDFPPDLLTRRGEPRVAEMIDSQQSAFDSRRQALEGQKAVLRQRVGQHRAQIEAARAQITFTERQMQLIEQEVTSIEPLVNRGVIARPRYLALLREGAGLSGTREQQRGAISQAEQGIGEAEMQMLQLDNNLLNDVATQLQDVRAKIADYEERLRGAADVQQRREVVAPVAGVVANMRFFTIGGVVRPGDPILDLVPRDETLVLDVRISPMDIDVVDVGQTAEVRLTAFRQRAMPILLGRVTYVSADLANDSRPELQAQPQQRSEQSTANAPYYRATVALDMEQIRRRENATLTAGMPGEVLIVAGERTMLSYLWQPLHDSLRRAFREH